MIILLVHGLGRTPFSFYSLVRRLRRWGYRGETFGDEPNDGIVALSETRIRDDDPLVVVPVTHTFMMNNAQVQAAIRRPLAVEAAR
jgi:hypothetical protein